MTKAQIREKYKDLRSKISEESIENLSLKIANNALKLNIWDLNTYHIFMPIAEKKEVNTDYILQILMGKDKEIIVPKTNFKTRTMEHYALNEHTKFAINKFNIPEPIENETNINCNPSEIDVVFVPLLSFDIFGNRIGYGMGFYDVFLKHCKPEVITIGLSFFEPENVEIPNETTDFKLTYAITPSRIFKFT